MLDTMEDWMAFEEKIKDCIQLNGLDCLEDHPNGYLSDQESDKAWKRWNLQFIATIKLKLNYNGRTLIENETRWLKAWATLKAHYKPKDSTTFIIAAEQLIDIKDQHETIGALEGELEKCFAKLKSVGENISPAFKAYLFLRALPDDYRTWKETQQAIYTFLPDEATLGAKKIVTWNQLAAMAKQKELELKGSGDPSIALVSKGKPFNGKNSKRLFSYTERNNKNGRKNKKPREERYCNFCKEMGYDNKCTTHNEADCWGKHPEKRLEHMVKRRQANDNTQSSSFPTTKLSEGQQNTFNKA